MKILVTSDSHGLTNELEALVLRHQNDVDVYYHCGDSELPPSEPVMSSFKIVTGNCDFFTKNYPEEIIDDQAGFRIYMTHGHLYRVKFSPLQLKYRAEEVGADLVFFGHTHIAGCSQEGNTIFINPGSLRLPRQRPEGTYVICDLNPKTKQVTVTFYSNEGHQIDGMTQHFEL